MARPVEKMRFPQEHGPTEQLNRGAARFEVRLPMKYRVVGYRKWREGWVDSMSFSDVVFSGAEQVEVGSSIDLRLFFPNPRKGHRGGVIVSRGKVTWSCEILDDAGYACIWATLTNPRLVRFNPETGAD